MSQSNSASIFCDSSYSYTDAVKLMRCPVCVVYCSSCMQQILESVDYCHQMSIVHRDLKVSHCIENSMLSTVAYPGGVHWVHVHPQDE